jgi:hypothetical protein
VARGTARAFRAYMRKNTLRFVCSIVLGAIAASAQAVSFGVIGGVPLNDPLSFHDESRPYIVGGSIEVRLPARFAVEADVLYQRVGNSTASFGIVTPSITSFSSRQRGNAWKFPVLGKYYFRPRTSAWQPFVGTGYVFRAIDFRSDVNETTVDSSGASHNLSFHYNSGIGLGVGAVFAGGIRFHTGRFAFSPQIRYTRWGDNQTNATSLRRNEAGILLGISF